MLMQVGKGSDDRRLLSELDESQAYFLSVGQMFCSRMRPELARLLTATNPHPPSRVRVNAVMANSLLFADAFKCPIGSPMNPTNKCDLWRRCV
jgi:predicted metalloendopeptidase